MQKEGAEPPVCLVYVESKMRGLYRERRLSWTKSVSSTRSI